MDAVSYCQVSTEEQAQEGVSLAAQEARVRVYCAADGLTLVTMVRDEGVSAATPPGLAAWRYYGRWRDARRNTWWWW